MDKNSEAFKKYYYPLHCAFKQDGVCTLCNGKWFGDFHLAASADCSAAQCFYVPVSFTSFSFFISGVKV